MSASQFFRRVLAPGRPERAVVLAVALGAATLIDPAKLTTGKRAAYRIGLAGLTAADIATDVPPGTSGTARSAAAVAAGGAVLGLSEAGEAFDARLQRALVRRGVSRPRLVLAAAGVAISLAAELPAVIRASRIRRALAARGLAGVDLGPETDSALAELPDGARAVIAGMLDYSAEPSAGALLAQLDSAREQLWEGVSGSYDVISIEVADADTLPRAVPHVQRFPVSATFTDPVSGSTRVLRLFVESGMLAQLTIEDASVTDEWSAGDANASALWPAQWPQLAEITFALDSEAPADRRGARIARMRPGIARPDRA